MSVLQKRYCKIYRQICRYRIASLNTPDFNNILSTATIPATAVQHPIFYHRNTDLPGINSNYQSKNSTTGIGRQAIKSIGPVNL
jgi:hypothetical protein